MTTGERIRERRKALDMTADELARLLGISRATVYRYENGEISKIPISQLSPIAAALHTSADYLMGWSDDPYAASRPDGKVSPDRRGFDAEAELRFALFGGDAAEITDEMFEEVKRFARYVAEREKENRRNK